MLALGILRKSSKTFLRMEATDSSGYVIEQGWKLESIRERRDTLAIYIYPRNL